MADMLLLQGAITGLKTAADIVIGLNKLNTLTEVNTKAIELQQIILSIQSSALSAQSEQLSQVEHIRQLEKEIADIKAWEETKQRYKLISPRDGTFVYSLKENCGPPEPAHWICAKCYEDGRKSILQRGEIDQRCYLYRCDSCKAVIRAGGEPFTYAPL